MVLANGTDLTIDTTAGGANISVGAIDGDSSETVTLDAGAGQVTVGAIGSGAGIGTVAITGNAGIVSSGSIVTNGGAVTLTSTGLIQLGGALYDSTNAGTAVAGVITLDGTAQLNNTDVTIRTDGTADAAVTIASGVNAQTAATQGLTINAGTEAVAINAGGGRHQGAQGPDGHKRHLHHQRLGLRHHERRGGG